MRRFVLLQNIITNFIKRQLSADTNFTSNKARKETLQESCLPQDTISTRDEIGSEMSVMTSDKEKGSTLL